MENEKIQSDTNSKKKSKKILLLIPIALVVAVFGFLLIAIVFSDPAEPTVEPITNEHNISSETTEADASANGEIRAGSAVSNKSVKISFKSCNTDFKDYSDYADLKEGFKVIEAVFDFENISSSDIILEGFDCYADGEKCESFFYVDEYSDPVLQSISAGRKLTDAKVYFEVPSDAEEIELEYSADFWNDEKYIFIVE